MLDEVLVLGRRLATIRVPTVLREALGLGYGVGGVSHMAPTTGSTKAAKTRTPRGSTPRVGLRRVSLLVPDTRSKAFARQAHRESVTVRNSPHADEDQAFVDAISASPCGHRAK
jgi:hypothetical protein